MFVCFLIAAKNRSIGIFIFGTIQIWSHTFLEDFHPPTTNWPAIYYSDRIGYYSRCEIIFESSFSCYLLKFILFCSGLSFVYFNFEGKNSYIVWICLNFKQRCTFFRHVVYFHWRIFSSWEGRGGTFKIDGIIYILGFKC